MPSTNSTYAVDETIAPGVRYTEEVGRTVKSLPVRYCSLWQEGEEIPVSELEVYSFRQRFGAVAVAAEGIGGVETPPQFRRRGYVRQLLTRATQGISTRVNVAFISDGIEDMYEKVGYQNCLVESHLSLKIRNVERALADRPLPPDERTVRVYDAADLPAIIALYNATHAQRPWTHTRHAEWNRFVPVKTWEPGSTALVLVEDEKLVGYAIYNEQFYGWPNSPAIHELGAQDGRAANRLIAEMAQLCWQFRTNEFTIREPLDSIVGFAARQLGCDYNQSHPTTGGMLGAILNRDSLLAALEPELRRRLPGPQFLADHTEAFPRLQQGELLPDQHALLRLLIGYWSMHEAQMAGITLAPRFADLCAAWFPGGGSPTLPIPYAHKLDRY